MDKNTDKKVKEPTFDNYTFWDAYKMVREGKWTEDEFHMWAQSVWNNGGEFNDDCRKYGLA